MRGEGREKEREKNIDLLLLKHTPTRNLACNPGMRPDGNQTCDLLLCGMMPNQTTPVRASPTILSQ